LIVNGEEDLDFCLDDQHMWLRTDFFLTLQFATLSEMEDWDHTEYFSQDVVWGINTISISPFK